MSKIGCRHLWVCLFFPVTYRVYLNAWFRLFLLNKSVNDRGFRIFSVPDLSLPWIFVGFSHSLLAKPPQTICFSPKHFSSLTRVQISSQIIFSKSVPVHEYQLTQSLLPLVFPVQHKKLWITSLWNRCYFDKWSIFSLAKSTHAYDKISSRVSSCLLMAVGLLIQTFMFKHEPTCYCNGYICSCVFHFIQAYQVIFLFLLPFESLQTGSYSY